LLTEIGAAFASSSSSIVPFDVTSVAEYDFDASIVIAGDCVYRPPPAGVEGVFPELAPSLEQLIARSDEIERASARRIIPRLYRTQVAQVKRVSVSCPSHEDAGDVLGRCSMLSEPLMLMQALMLMQTQVQMQMQMQTLARMQRESQTARRTEQLVSSPLALVSSLTRHQTLRVR
jgi:hypothetical protein